MGGDADIDAAQPVKRRWRVLAWIVASVSTVAGVAILVFIAMMNDLTTDMQATNDHEETARFIVAGLAFPLAGIGLAAGLYHGRRWARVVFYLVAGIFAFTLIMGPLWALIGSY